MSAAALVTDRYQTAILFRGRIAAGYLHWSAGISDRCQAHGHWVAAVSRDQIVCVRLAPACAAAARLNMRRVVAASPEKAISVAPPSHAPLQRSLTRPTRYISSATPPLTALLPRANARQTRLLRLDTFFAPSLLRNACNAVVDNTPAAACCASPDFYVGCAPTSASTAKTCACAARPAGCNCTDKERRASLP